MPMEVNRRELKARARERIRASHPAFWKVTLVYLLLTSGVAAVADLAGAARIGSPGPLGYLRPLSRPVGHPVYHGDGSGLSVVGPSDLPPAVRRVRHPHRRLLHGRPGDPDECHHLFLRPGLGRGLCPPPSSLVLLLLSGLLSSGGGMLFLYLLAMGGTFLGSLWIGYRYAMAPYLLIDHPEQGAGAAVRESVAMMKGWKWEFCKLDLSFLGWHLINALLSLAVTLVFALPMLPALLESGADLARILMDPSLALPWTAVLLSSLIQLPLSLWLKPYQTVTFA